MHRELGVEEAWRRYFETLARAASSGLFDSLSHPDLIKVFGDRAAETEAEATAVLDASLPS